MIRYELLRIIEGPFVMVLRALVLRKKNGFLYWNISSHKARVVPLISNEYSMKITSTS